MTHQNPNFQTTTTKEAINIYNRLVYKYFMNTTKKNKVQIESDFITKKISGFGAKLELVHFIRLMETGKKTHNRLATCCLSLLFALLPSSRKCSLSAGFLLSKID